MGWTGAAGCLLLAVLATSGAASAGPVPEGLFGEWAGKVAEAEPPLGEFGDPVQLTLAADGSGFTLSAKAGDAELRRLTMAPTKPSAEIYGPSSGGGMMSMFSANDPPDPLAGEHLQWARVGGQELIVYSLRIEDDGGFVLDRFALSRAGEELALRLTRRDAAADERVLTARLTKSR